METLVDLLRARAASRPDGTAYVFLAAGELAEHRLTYGELDRAARRIATALRRSCAAGERALLLFPPGLDYVQAFFGCLYAGMVGVCAYPPPLNRGRRLLPRLKAILADSRARVALTTESMLAAAQAFLHQEELSDLLWLRTDRLDDSTAGWEAPGTTADDLAFLMYTSGSTGTPKGVMVSHGNTMHNLAAFPGFRQRPLSASVSWLPLFHDLGLVFGVLQPLYQGAPAILLPPEAFVRRPVLWLQAISRYRASATFGPNFAYDLCARRIEPHERAGLDLSSLSFVLNGSEPVRAETLDRFVAAFGPCGFRRAAFYPAFGLSEGTSDVSGGADFAPPSVCTLAGGELARHRIVEVGGEAADVRRIVGLGPVLPGQQVAIVDPETLAPCPPDGVGEVWVQGPSVAMGYWERPEETEETFRARLAGPGDGPFLRTGDLGFLRDGELFLTGRLKDLLILRGVNRYPQDVELSVEESHPALRPGCGAAFACEAEGEERLVVVHEIDAAPGLAWDEVCGNIRERLVEEHETDPWQIVLIAPGALPKTSSGKIQRQACREAFLGGELNVVFHWRAATTGEVDAPAPAASSVEGYLIAAVARWGGVAPQDVDLAQPLARYGLTSVTLTALAADLERRLGRRLPLNVFFEYPTIGALARHLSGDRAPGAASPRPPVHQDEPIAIVGMSCRLPGAPDLRAYWRLLVEGVDAVSAIPEGRWDVAALYDPHPSAPGKMTAREGGFLAGLDRFDPLFFGISPHEAAHLDPRQRLMLELSWEALEHAGIPPGSLAGRSTGVFIATLTDDFLHLLFDDLSRGDAYSGTGGANSLVANRISYCLDLRGPSLTVDTACSGSLVALHLACQSLQSGESGLALVGGVMVNLRPDGFLFFSQVGALAPDGRSKPFSSEADGIGRAEGAGLLVLKPLSRALADGDRVLATIRGSAVNQDGTSNGLTAPNPRAQEALLREAYRRAGVPPQSVQYVEAHGTGTRLGDAIEASALTAVLGAGRAPGDAFAVGSVKSNFGHAEAAAGVAGVIKVVLAMQHRLLPPTLHLAEPPAQASPLRLQERLGPWPAEGRPLIAGVSGFGIGGTNAHVVLAEAPAVPAATSEERAGWHLLPLSARSPQALSDLRRAFLRSLAGDLAAFPLHDVCSTASARRDHHPHRLAVTGRTHSEMIAALSAVDSTSSAAASPRLIFVFSGQGSQWPRMGLDLAQEEPVFRETLERAARLFPERDGRSLLAELETGAELSRLQRTDLLQPAIFAVQVALYELWRSWGLVPHAVGGHSLGEAAAAYACGALSLEDAARVVDRRSRLMARATGLGSAAAVELPLERLEPRLAGRPDVALAGLSSPTALLVSGTTEAVAELLAGLRAEGVRCRTLPGDAIPLHSRLLEPLLAPLARELLDLRPRPATVPFVSAVTGAVLAGEQLDAGYWVRNLREPFRFTAAMAALLGLVPAEDTAAVFLEVSPHPLLTSPMRDTLRQLGRAGRVLSSLRRGEDERYEMLSSLGELYSAGCAVDWRQVYRAGRLVDLPSYPWQRERYWFQETAPLPGAQGRTPAPILWDVEVGGAPQSWLAEHRVRGAVVLPAALSLDLALAGAARALPRPERHLLERVELRQALVLAGNEPRKLRVAILPEPAGEASFEILSRSEEAEPWTAITAGRIATLSEGAEEPEELETIEAIRRRCPEEISAADHYVALDRHGLHYGPSFQALRGLRRGDGEALAELCLDDSLRPQAGDFAVHPILLDAAFQTAAVFLREMPGAADASAVYLPVGVERLRVRGAPGSALWCHARLRQADGERMLVDLHLYDPSQRPAIEVAGFRIERAGARLPEGDDGDLLYRVDWLAVEAAASRRGAGEGDLALLVGGGALAQTLAAELAARGIVARRMAAAAEPEPYRRRLAEPLPAPGTGHVEVVFLAALDPSPDAEAGEPDRGASAALLAAVQAAAELPEAPRFWVVTRGAQPVGPVIAPGQALLWGLARAVGQQEHPELWGGLLDLDPAAPPDEAQQICDWIEAPGPEDQIALRGTRRLAPRLKRHSPTPATGGGPMRSGTYLITGGLGALGLQVARSLVALGARRLVLLGRTGLPPRRTWSRLSPEDRDGRRVAAVRELESAGASVHVATLDVADETAMRAFLETFEAEAWPPIRGVVHAAGLLDDRLLLRMDAAGLETVLRPKVLGAWVLHRLFVGRPLDFFILFSSLSALLVPPGQGSYAAANAFLDALAHHRRSLGLPGQSLDWGPWAESGMAVGSGALWGAAGAVTSLAPEAALRLFARALADDAPQLVAGAVDWDLVRDRLYHGAGLPPIFADLAMASDTAPTPDAPDTPASVEERLREMAAAVLRLPLARLDAKKPLRELGFDSIMAVELRAHLESSLGLTLPMRMLLDAPSVHQLASRLNDHLGVGATDRRTESLT